MESGNNQENDNPDQEPISKPQDIHENEARISTDNEEDDDGEEEEEEEEELGFEFSFTLGEAKYPSSPISAEEAFVNGQIKPVVQFNGRDLTTTAAAQSPDEMLDLPSKPPVKNVYVELSGEGRRGAEAGEEGDDDVYAVTSSPTPACKKSNSTGFSRIWRFSRDFAMGRSHSDGRDAFVFLNEGHAPPSSSGKAAEEESKSSAVKVKGQKKNKKKKEEGEASKSKTVKVSKDKGKKVNNTAAASSASLSACEAYMRSKADEKRRSTTTYLPYRPGLMGFFTNVSGGMSKNVHPF